MAFYTSFIVLNVFCHYACHAHMMKCCYSNNLVSFEKGNVVVVLLNLVSQ